MRNEPLLGGMAQSAVDRETPLLRPGNTNCGGCGMSNLLQMMRRAVADRPVQLVIPACCAAISAGAFPQAGLGAPTVLTTFASAAAVATGAAAVARLNGEETRVICLAGDGGSYDIGFATMSAAAERNEDILYICYDNEIYGNTGGQRSSATPAGAVTTSTPGGKVEQKKDIMAIMAAHRIPYAASLSLAHADDTLRKLRHALDLRGFRFLHVLSPCPTGWKSEPALGMELVRLAVRSGLYPVLEVFDGRRHQINIEPEFSDEALEMYLSLQRRFQNTGLKASDLRPAIERHWLNLRVLSGRIVPARRETR
ncbi:thiamine pyrophosphate-dependent enzyme [Geomonas paludis]|uniref:2-ketoisovalerate ferredoxin oxidoreductase subunit beta n=1 Tax=Geomonas paludis TaxID=2740185 RepID=A0A6V8MTW9_9BACT|nr:thiamine pyrophosphate-dependent enzyme [Geomonas paludis]UPU35278.1 thiamine pyrophosphate-dependent enzyme [Geomonas paludis]GFO63177.1 2-ketoisovalerate ferredoxin oxidoreductase subunit beta [Geomonas paludis]